MTPPSQQPGRHRRVLPVFTDVDGSAVEIHVHEVFGSEPGPRLTLLSGTHGNEWFSHEIVRRCLALVDPASLRGTLVGLPVANPYAFRKLTRYSADPQQVGYVNLNKAFLRPENSTTALTGRVLADEIIRTSTHVIDFHPGPWGSVWKGVLFAGSGPTSAAARAMARAFGVPALLPSDPEVDFPNSSAEVAERAGIPLIGPEVGGLGFGREFEDPWLEENVTGVLRVMALIGMIDGDLSPTAAPPALPELRVEWDLRPSRGGIMDPIAGPEDLLKPVRAGQLLGRLICPVTLEVVEEYVSPGDGILIAVPRRYPALPHNFGFVVAVPSDDRS